MVDEDLEIIPILDDIMVTGDLEKAVPGAIDVDDIDSIESFDALFGKNAELAKQNEEEQEVSLKSVINDESQKNSDTETDPALLDTPIKQEPRLTSIDKPNVNNELEYHSDIIEIATADASHDDFFGDGLFTENTTESISTTEAIPIAENKNQQTEKVDYAQKFAEINNQLTEPDEYINLTDSTSTDYQADSFTISDITDEQIITADFTGDDADEIPTTLDTDNEIDITENEDGDGPELVNSEINQSDLITEENEAFALDFTESDEEGIAINPEITTNEMSKPLAMPLETLMPEVHPPENIQLFAHRELSDNFSDDNNSENEIHITANIATDSAITDNEAEITTEAKTDISNKNQTIDNSDLDENSIDEAELVQILNEQDKRLDVQQLVENVMLEIMPTLEIQIRAQVLATLEKHIPDTMKQPEAPFIPEKDKK